MSAASSDVLVVGGGVIGLSIAWRAAALGLRVALADDKPGRGASWAAAGMLAPVTEVHYGEERLFELGAESIRRYPGFVSQLEEETGRSVGYRRAGTLMVAPTADDLAELGELHRHQERLGLVVRRLTSRETRALEPALAAHVRGGFLVEGDHAVDNRLLAEALLDACRRAGVEILDRRVAQIGVADDRVAGATLAGGTERACGTLVLAAGCWSASIPGLPGYALPPVRPVKGQLLYLRGPADPPLISRSVRGVGVYVVPRGDGRIVVGATVEERGFDTAITAGAVYELLRSAYELLPELREWELLEAAAGLRPGSPDNAPLLGPGAIEGLVVAAGHYRNGILLTPVTADEIAALLATGEVTEILTPFSPLRFEREPA